jgi:hypothetical protein
MSSSVVDEKLWNYCNILRDDQSACGHAQAGGLSYLLARGVQASGDYASTRFVLSQAEGLSTVVEQFNVLLWK